MQPRDSVVVLQARLGSRRLPGKVLMGLAGQSVLAHCVCRLAAAGAGRVVVATTTLKEDDALAREARRLGAQVMRGPVDDVLARFALAIVTRPIAYVIRATADNPAVDIEAPRRVLDALRAGVADYVREAQLPHGSGVEGIRADTLLDADHRASSPSDREHVTPYVRRMRRRYRAVEMPAPPSLRRSDLRFTVDTVADLGYMRRVFAQVGHVTEPPPLLDLIEAADRVEHQAEVA